MLVLNDDGWTPFASNLDKPICEKVVAAFVCKQSLLNSDSWLPGSANRVSLSSSEWVNYTL